MEYLIIAILKMLDNIITTSKTILIQKHKPLLVAVCIFISQILFYTVISQVVQNDNQLTIIIVSLSASLGTYIAFPINDKFSEDKTYINILTAKDKENIQFLIDYLKKNSIKNIVLDTVNKKDEHTLAVMVFARTKSQSKLIDNYIIQSKNKIFREVW